MRRMRNSNLSKRGLMRRATTPTHTFTFPKTVPIETITEMTVTYSQCGKTILQKTLSDMVAGEDFFSCRLSQDETKLFAPGKALIQVRAKNSQDVTLASQMIWLTVKPVLESGDM